MYEGNAFGLAGWLAGRVLRLAIVVLVVPVLLVVWWELGNRGVITIAVLWVVLRVWVAAVGQVREQGR